MARAGMEKLCGPLPPPTKPGSGFCLLPLPHPDLAGSFVVAGGCGGGGGGGGGGVCL